LPRAQRQSSPQSHAGHSCKPDAGAVGIIDIILHSQLQDSLLLQVGALQTACLKVAKAKSRLTTAAVELDSRP
jgi:hypothetical protein